MQRKTADLVGAVISSAALLLTSGASASAQPPDVPFDVGSYPTTPSPPWGQAGTPEAGARVEAQRLADYVVGPWEVDSSLTRKFTGGVAVLDGPAALNAQLPPDLAEVGLRHSVLDGFSTYRASSDKGLRNIVLRFADAPSAAAAVADFAEVAAARQVPGGPIDRVPVPGHPATAAFGNLVLGEDELDEQTYVRAFTAHGPYVLYQLGRAVSGPDAAANLIAGTLDRQVPLIDRFQPTAPFLLPGVPLDPTGLLAKTLPTDPADVTPEAPGVYGTHGALHFQNSPFASAALFAETGLTTWVLAGAGVYETRDAQSAQRFVDVTAQEATELADATAVSAVAGLSGSRCMTLRFPETGVVDSYCLAVADRYVIETEDPTLTQAHQKLAAQYALLTHR